MVTLPDHQVTSRFATTAYDLVGDATAYPIAGQPWRPQRLFQAVIPASNFQAMIDYAKANDIDVSGFEQLPFDRLNEIEAQVTHILDVRDLFEIKQAARLAHRTQFGQDHLFRKLSEEVSRKVMGYQHFIQVYPAQTDGLRQHRAADLFVGD